MKYLTLIIILITAGCVPPEYWLRYQPPQNPPQEKQIIVQEPVKVKPADNGIVEMTFTIKIDRNGKVKVKE